MKILTLVLALSTAISFGYSQKTDSTSSHEKILPWFVERFKLSAGGFYVINKSSIQVGINGDPGTEIDPEKDLGFNREIVTFLANFQWQVSPRSRISLNYYNIKRNSSHTLKRDIVFEDNTYYANSLVNCFFNSAIYQVSYGYAILSKPNYEAGVLIGTHIVGAKVGISLDGANAGITTSNDFGFTAPLPDLGLWAGFALSKRFAINMDISYFALTMNSKSGRLLSYNFSCTYKLIDQLDLSLGYNGLNFKFDVVKNAATGKFKWGYNGPALVANFSFGKKSWRH